MIGDDEIFSQLDQAFKADRENFSNPQALYLYFSSLVDLNAAGKRDIQEVFDVYDEVVAKLEDVAAVEGVEQCSVGAEARGAGVKDDVPFLEVVRERVVVGQHEDDLLV